MSKMEVLARMNLLECAACSVLNHISLGMSGAACHTNCAIGSNTVTCRRAALSPRSAQGTARLSHSVSAIGALGMRSEEHTSELQSLAYLVCRLLLEKKKNKE